MHFNRMTAQLGQANRTMLCALVCSSKCSITDKKKNFAIIPLPLYCPLKYSGRKFQFLRKTFRFNGSEWSSPLSVMIQVFTQQEANS